ncbi:hypothetical protein B0H34DRAFT_702892 [Crassisporium funariophilum]|nr:hypothetical protein B0H34DRAFT_702892 [Crassisporium funariophilum]
MFVSTYQLGRNVPTHPDPDPQTLKSKPKPYSEDVGGNADPPPGPSSLHCISRTKAAGLNGYGMVWFVWCGPVLA